MSKIKLALNQAAALARRVVSELSPACHRIEIAGSIRRKKETIGDIEIVCIPQLITDLWGESTPNLHWLEGTLFNLVQQGRLIKGDKDGSNYKNFGIPAVDGLQVDLFITTPESWGVIFAIRTGSAEFSRKLVTQRNKGGLLPSHLRVERGRVWENSHPLELDERGFLELCGGWVEPELRNNA